MEQVAERRSAIRRESEARRNSIPAERRGRFSEEITNHAIEFASNVAARLVHVYLTFRSEVDTSGIIEGLLGRGIRVAVPIVEPSEKGNLMIHSELIEPREVVAGRFGINEPRERREISVEDVDLVFV